MTDLSFLNHITFTRLKITFRAVERIILPEYKGSAFRGCLGDTFKRAVCIRPGMDCRNCNLRYKCSFSKLFNSFVDNHPKYTNSPHAYIVSPMPDRKTNFELGETFWFEMTLIGSSVNLIPALINAFGRMGETGIGSGHGKFEPVELEYLDKKLKYKEFAHFSKPDILSPKIFPASETNGHLTLKFETPLRLKEKGKLVKNPPEFNLFASRLLQRLSLLAYFHCDAPWQEEAVNYKPNSDNIKIVESQMEWVNWRRFSGTQGTRMNFDGMTGTIIYKGDLKPWMPLFAAGTWLHAGLTTTFGLGKYFILNDH